MKVFIIIVTYNGAEWLEFCLELLHDIPDTWRILIVDNGSSDNTVEAVKAKYPGAILLSNAENAGFGAGNNIGLRHALAHDADYVFLLNQDAQIDAAAISKMIHIHSRHPEYLILSPLQMDQSGEQLEPVFFRDCVSVIPGLDLNAPVDGAPEVYDMPRSYASTWLMSRKCLETIGGFNPVFFHYVEDEDYRVRVHFHGYKIGLVPSVLARHAQNPSPKSKRDIEFLLRLQNMVDPAQELPSIFYIARMFCKVIIRNARKSRWFLVKHYVKVLILLLKRKIMPGTCNPSRGTGRVYLE